jgi:pyruvate dehydrogenase E2 component (dihydrolipoamide acetyltransferase)
VATEVILPRVDMDMESGKFSAWLVKEGDTVTKGQSLFEIETDKAAMEVEAPASGVLKGVTVAPGDVLPVGAIIAWIAAVDEDVGAIEAKAAVSGARAKSADPKREGASVATEARHMRPSTDLKATPLARRLAAEAGLDLASIVGTGPSRRIQARDALAARESAPRAGAAALFSEWLIRGEGTPIVLVHGFGADSNGWRPLASRLGDRHPVLAVDLPGHGQSAATGAETFERIVDLVESSVVGESVRRAHWIGHSLGGAVAAQFAARHPAAVASMTLLAPAGLGPEINAFFIDGFLRARTAGSLAPILRLLVENEEALGNALVKTTLRQREQRGLAACQGKIAEVAFSDGIQTIDIRAALSAYDGPARVIFGRQDKIIPARHTANLPGSVGLHLLASVGHMPHLEARKLVAQIAVDNVWAGERRAE